MSSRLQRIHGLLCSRFVDEAMYRAALGDGRANLATVMRYISFEVDRRPALSPYFDPQFYRATMPDLLAGHDPLLHFLEHGLADWRDPHPLVDLHWMATQDAARFGAVPGAGALAEALDGDFCDPSPYFDVAFYAAQPGAPIRGMLRHFLAAGIDAGLRPNEWLDPAWYAAAHDDVPQPPLEALRHFVLHGDGLGHAAGPAFDGLLYRRRYTDVADAGVPPLRHFLANGRAEGRQAPNDRPARRVAAATPPDGGGGAMATGAAIETDPRAMQAAYDTLALRLAERRQAEKDAVQPVAPPLVSCADPVADIARIVLPECATPRLSILVPAYDELEHTVACLLAICRDPPATEFEVVLADDCSTDPDMALLAGVANLVVLRQERNLGFIGNCNAAFERCAGELVLLLNNDAQPLAGAVDRLVAAMDADPGIGAAGPKLVYPSGRLQEAGCSLKPNGDSAMVGLFRDADEPGFCYDRDVAYCSGAALLVRRALVGPELFDRAFQPAYCEDADLCLRLQAGGHRVRYVAGAVVVHHLSVSTNRQHQARKLQGIRRNQQALQMRWGSQLAAMDRMRPIAFYLPQFHPTPENDLWWGAGFTEWRNVTRAQPSYAGHYQPHLPTDLGYYDLRVADSLRAQAALAARYGIEGFCVYYYNFGERRVLGTPLAVLRANPDVDFRYCLCWANENWTRHWDGGEREVLLEQRYDAATLAGIVADAVADAADPRYLRVRGRPLFLVYRPLLLPDAAAFAATCRAAFAEAGFPGVHLVYVESMEAVDRRLRPADIGFDASVEFPPHGRAVPSEAAAEIVKDGWTGYRYDYAATVLAFLTRDSVPYPRYPAVFPSWDNTPRQPLRGTSFDGAEPAAFRLYVEAKIDEARQFLLGEERLLFVNAWNEWAEGAHLEPDTAHGHGWLEALRGAVEARTWT